MYVVIVFYTHTSSSIRNHRGSNNYHRVMTFGVHSTIVRIRILRIQYNIGCNSIAILLLEGKSTERKRTHTM